MKSLSIAAAAATLFASAALADVDPIVIKGSKFFYKTNGTQFYMKGIAYQQDVSTNGSISTANGNKYSDPLADVAGCRRDVPFLRALQTNTIRVYAIDPTADHSVCMKLLQDNGIYVVADLSEPATSINRDNPEWTTEIYNRYTSVIDAMAPFNNVLGFFAGNEVSNQFNNTPASAYVKAAVRDSKAYIASKGYRTIGVGYATNDDAEIRANMAAYFNCGNRAESIDFWGYNIYSWCGDSSFRESGFDVRTKEFASYSVPVFFAEYGCNTVQPRLWTDTLSLYSTDMTGVWSGGIVYMYFQETNNYGLVTVNGNTVSTLGDFSRLSTQIAKATPSSVQANAYNPANTAAAACPSVNREWAAAANPLPPVANAQLCSCMVSGAACSVSNTVSPEDYGKLFGQICGLMNGQACLGIRDNATSGTFGAYSMCSAKDQLTFALNQYYSLSSGANKADACKFGGSAALKSVTSATGTCTALLQQAGAAGTGTVTSRPSGASGGAGASSTGKSDAGVTVAPSLNFGFFHLGAYLVGAALSGAAMILL